MSSSIKCTLRITRRTSESSSWAEIAELIDSCEAYRLLSVGDRIQCQSASGDEQLYIEVACVDLYNQGEVTFIIKELPESRMNQKNTNDGGFICSEMKNYLDTTVFKKLPKALQDIVTPRHLTQTLPGHKYECDAKLWLPSVDEVFGSTDSGERQLPLFMDARNRVMFDSNGEIQWWWLRSSLVGSFTSFLCVSDTGSISYANASRSIGICPCFSICKRSKGVLVA